MKDRWAEERAKWRGLILEQGQSGRSVAGFCRERGLRNSQFFAWKKRLRQAEARNFVEVEVVSRRDTGKDGRERNGAIEIRLRTGRSLMVEPGFDANHLWALLLVAEAEA